MQRRPDTFPFKTLQKHGTIFYRVLGLCQGLPCRKQVYHHTAPVSHRHHPNCNVQKHGLDFLLFFTIKNGYPFFI